MSLKILGGTLKGLTLDVPPGQHIRPTSVLLRRKIFDSRQNLSGKTFIDLCAGSGAVGIEALSRGAPFVELIESDKKTYSHLRKNLQLAERRWRGERFPADITRDTCLRWLESYRTQPGGEDVILFFDPPYEDHELYRQVKELLCDQDLFFGELWVESDHKKGVPPEFWHDRKRGQESNFFKHSDSYVLMLDLSHS